MSTLVVYAEDMGTAYHTTFLSTTNETYLTAARQNTAGNVSVTNSSPVGQSTGFTIQQSAIEFDTSALDGETVSAAALAFAAYSFNDVSTTDFYIDVFPYDFGDEVTTADWRDSDTGLPALTRVMYFYSADLSGTAGYNNSFTSESGAPGSVNKTGMTRYILASREHANESEPTTAEYLAFRADATYPARLTITYTSGSPSATGTITAPATTVSGAATMVAVLTATGAASLGAVTATGAAGQTFEWSGAVTLSAPVVTGVAASVGALVIVKPDSDITTTGWADTPLWSKIDDDPDSPDGVVISAAVA